MIRKSIIALLCMAIALVSQTACSSSGAHNGTTTIDGRTFDFTVPKERYPTKLPKEFLIGALNTPSPPPEIWRPFRRMMFGKRAHDFVRHYLKKRPPATKAEVQALIQHTKDNMIFVKGGTFMMVDFGWLTKAHRPMTDSTRDDPPHKVTLDSYSLMKNRVTYAEYDVYTRAEGLPPAGIGSFSIILRYPDFPVLTTWQKARDYCLWLGKKTGQPFDIDTEAQYEYAARSGGQWLLLASTFQDEDKIVPNMRKFADLMDAKAKGSSPSIGVSVPVGTYGHNYLGFEDMIGPTAEWVYDWYAPYTKEPLVNPRGPKHGTEKVFRTAKIGYQGTISRGHIDPEDSGVTFRCAINSTEPWQ